MAENRELTRTQKRLERALADHARVRNEAQRLRDRIKSMAPEKVSRQVTEIQKVAARRQAERNDARQGEIQALEALAKAKNRNIELEKRIGKLERKLRLADERLGDMAIEIRELKKA